MLADGPFDERLMKTNVISKNGLHPCGYCSKRTSKPRFINENTLQTFIKKLSTKIDFEYALLTSPFAA